MMRRSLAIFLSLLTVGCVLSVAPCHTTQAASTMKPSVTYLHLLRHTPFFTSLNTSQLRWTIDHSREWETDPGAVIASGPGDSAMTDDSIWILLDGRWQLEENGRSHPAGHADPGKWFSANEASGTWRLVTTEHSYVMRITREDMDIMLAKNFTFDSHLRDGKAYYRMLFGPAAPRP
ncbi:cyclic nucleotide-binding domain-containing protein [Methylovorus mays]|uniref:hypothetical protein n=1 Tax=Methylovorus mays TaxID=184077 RepID=UPI001E2C07D1|nr:hypothetical protein [Methylovorus mays]MCB5206802.1 hypothetical protein [Methylovorus mays]